MLGIIGAMPQEVELIKAELEDVSEQSFAGMTFYSGLLRGKKTILVQCGVGKVHAATCVQVLADRFDVTKIINTGVAGSLDPAIDIGDIVLSTDAVQHDFDVTALGYAPGHIPGLSETAFAADRGMLDTAARICPLVNPDIKTFSGRVATGDQFISSGAQKQAIIDAFHAMCAEMEGGAIAQAAARNGIPFLIVRAISDKADDSAHMDYPEFEREAIRHISRLVFALAEELE